jgi:hypothetical protein
MEELAELRELVENHDYEQALALIDEMEEMAKEDKIIKIKAFIRVLLIHLIKQQAEKRSTRSWENSIDHALDGIADSNRRKKSKGYYMPEQELREAIDEKFGIALKMASREAFSGAFSIEQVTELIDAEALKRQALDLILNYDPQN